MKTLFNNLNLYGAFTFFFVIFSPLSKAAIKNQIEGYYPIYDGNGNITKYVDSNGEPIYEAKYDPFGNIIEEKIKPGEEKPAPFGFSTKVHDRLSEDGDGSDLIYYGYRHYSPKLGRFISRDPIEEAGGINLYAMAGNDVINNIEILGYLFVTTKVKKGEINNSFHTPQTTPDPRNDYSGISIPGLHSLAASSLDTDLVDHYYGGSGDEFCVTCHQDIIDFARQNGKPLGEVEYDHWEKFEEWADNFSCSSKKGTHTMTPPLDNTGTKSTRSVNYLGTHNAIGRASFRIEYKCNITIECVCCPKDSGKGIIKSLAIFQCDYKYNSWDWFEDALDLTSLIPGTQESIHWQTGAKGVAFKIEGAWNVTNEGANVYDTCY